MRENGKQRDVRFDVIKAVAIILVFLGHIMQFGFDSYTGNPAFQIIWALQIPLFMFVSGYFSTNEKQLSAGGGTVPDRKAGSVLCSSFCLLLLCD